MTDDRAEWNDKFQNATTQRDMTHEPTSRAETTSEIALVITLMGVDAGLVSIIMFYLQEWTNTCVGREHACFCAFVVCLHERV